MPAVLAQPPQERGDAAGVRLAVRRHEDLYASRQGAEPHGRRLALGLSRRRQRAAVAGDALGRARPDGRRREPQAQRHDQDLRVGHDGGQPGGRRLCVQEGREAADDGGARLAHGRVGEDVHARSAVFPGRRLSGRRRGDGRLSVPPRHRHGRPWRLQARRASRAVLRVGHDGPPGVERDRPAAERRAGPHRRDVREGW